MTRAGSLALTSKASACFRSVRIAAAKLAAVDGDVCLASAKDLDELAETLTGAFQQNAGATLQVT